jgi:diguanylate cyclase (GGDEF)-like protein
MLIRELLAQKKPVDVKSIRPESTLFELAGKLRQYNIGALLVTDDEDNVVGVVSERDLVRAVTEFRDGFVDRPVSGIMTRSVISCVPEDNVVVTLAVMNQNRIRHMPVLEDGQPLAMISIREFDHACRQLQIESRTDELTGLANRRYFMETLGTELSRSQRYQTPLSLAILDIDHFKHVNDTFGHEAGDRVLCDLGKLLVRELRTFDGIGRLGGEEFAILFANTSATNAKKACERLLAAIRSEEVVTDEGAIRFTASFGLADAGDDTHDSRCLLKAVDKLLYQAKNEGRNRIVVKPARPRPLPLPKITDVAGCIPHEPNCEPAT